MTDTNHFELTCPSPQPHGETIQLAYGGGGRLMHQLIEQVFRPAFGNIDNSPLHDSVVLDMTSTRIAMTTDSYVVDPLFFPGGDIGSMSVHGTVNDLAMSGAYPLYISAGFILEEGLPMETLKRVVHSMQQAAEQAGVRVVTGDTKVVDQGTCDGLFINTTGIGSLKHDLRIDPSQVHPGDIIILSNDIGRHGTAIMAQREGLAFETTIESDSTPLNHLVQALLEAGYAPHCLRDLTRGGLATALVEIAQTAEVEILIERTAVPVRDEVQGACELLGLDPLYVANEGCCVVILPESEAGPCLDLMRARSESSDATIIGTVTQAKPVGGVILRSEIGALRVVDMLSGEQLPRIC